MKEISLHIMDIAENGVTAGAKTIQIAVEENLRSDRLQVAIRDDGKGMDAEMLSRIADPFVTTRTTRKAGLGIPLFKAAAEACNGRFVIQSRPGMGTNLEIVFQHSHIDRMPLGDLNGTFLTLLVGYPAVRWIFEYAAVPASEVEQKHDFIFDSQPVCEMLGDVPLTEPEVLSYLKNLFYEGIGSIRKQIVYPVL